MNNLLIRLGVLVILVGAFSCEKDEDPIVNFEISPRIGHYSQEFTFDASASRDVESRDHELEFRWDFDDDGNWDTEWLFKAVAKHYYSERRIYTVCLQVRDNSGNTTIGKRQVETTLLNLKGLAVDARDGEEYSTVLIDSIWWMAEDLHHGKWISMWEKALQTNNGIIERYGKTDFNNLDVLSGYYNYGEAMDYVYREKNPGVCPPGWYIPSNDEWLSLVEHVGDGRDPAIFLSVIGDEGVNLAYSGRRYVGWGQSVVDHGGLYWTSSGTFQMESFGFNIFYYPKDTTEMRTISYEGGVESYGLYLNHYALPLRCVKKNIR